MSCYYARICNQAFRPFGTRSRNGLKHLSLSNIHIFTTKETIHSEKTPKINFLYFTLKCNLIKTTINYRRGIGTQDLCPEGSLQHLNTQSDSFWFVATRPYALFSTRHGFSQERKEFRRSIKLGEYGKKTKAWD